jgi:hypothetical protein
MVKPDTSHTTALDKCEICKGAKGGTPGNENIINGQIVCDYCHAEMDTSHTTVLAKADWDRDRAQLRIEAPSWEMPAWSRAPAWRRSPYVVAAQRGTHADE